MKPLANSDRKLTTFAELYVVLENSCLTTTGLFSLRRSLTRGLRRWRMSDTLCFGCCWTKMPQIVTLLHFTTTTTYRIYRRMNYLG